MDVGTSTAKLEGGDVIVDTAEPRPKGASLMCRAAEYIGVASCLVTRTRSVPQAVEGCTLQ
ncbi:hypothetical protein IG631_20851 [Alternaria alternata]|nr:hypothetical protein IG631_20851 [Alternaria alternata]